MGMMTPFGMGMNESIWMGMMKSDMEWEDFRSFWIPGSRVQ